MVHCDQGRPTPWPTPISFCGHELTSEEIRLLREIVRDFPALSLTELSRPSASFSIGDALPALSRIMSATSFCSTLETGAAPIHPCAARNVGPGAKNRLLRPFKAIRSPRPWDPSKTICLWSSTSSRRRSRTLFRQYVHRYHYLGYRVLLALSSATSSQPAFAGTRPGLFTVHERRLENGPARPLDWMERCRTADQSSTGRPTTVASSSCPGLR